VNFLGWTCVILGQCFGETISKGVIYIWIRRKQQRIHKRTVVQDVVITIVYQFVCCFCCDESWHTWRSMSTSGVLGRAFMQVMRSSSDITSDGFISSRARSS